jgi:hypothetical protein
MYKKRKYYKKTKKFYKKKYNKRAGFISKNRNADYVKAKLPTTRSKQVTVDKTNFNII